MKKFCMTAAAWAVFSAQVLAAEIDQRIEQLIKLAENQQKINAQNAANIAELQKSQAELQKSQADANQKLTNVERDVAEIKQRLESQPSKLAADEVKAKLAAEKAARRDAEDRAARLLAEKLARDKLAEKERKRTAARPTVTPPSRPTLPQPPTPSTVMTYRYEYPAYQPSYASRSTCTPSRLSLMDPYGNDGYGYSGYGMMYMMPSYVGNYTHTLQYYGRLPDVRDFSPAPPGYQVRYDARQDQYTAHCGGDTIYWDRWYRQWVTK